MRPKLFVLVLLLAGLAPLRALACQGHRWSMELDACVVAQEKLLQAVRAYEGRLVDVRWARAFRVTLEYQSTLVRRGYLDSILLDPPDALPGDRRAEYFKAPERRCADHFVLVPFGQGIMCLVHPRNWTEAKRIARFLCGSCEAYTTVSAGGWMACRRESPDRCELPAHSCDADCSWQFLASHFEMRVPARIWRIVCGARNARLLLALLVLVIVRLRRKKNPSPRGEGFSTT